MAVVRPNPYYNNPFFGQIAQNLSAAIFGAPELEAVRLRNESMKQDLADRETARIQRDKQLAARDSFFDAITSVPEKSTAVGSAGVIESPAGGSTAMKSQRYALQKPDMLSSVFADPGLAQMAVEGGVLTMPDITRAQEARLTREDNQEFRGQQNEANIASRELMASEGNANRRAMAAQSEAARLDRIQYQAMARLDQLAAQFENERELWRLKANDPMAREMHQQRMRLIESQIGATQALAGLRGAQTADEVAQAGTRGTKGGARPFQVDPRKREGMASELNTALEQRGVTADEASLSWLIDQMAEQYGQTGRYDLTSILDDAPTTTTPESLFGLLGGNTKIQRPGPVVPPFTPSPAAAPPAAAPAAPAAAPAPADALAQARDAIARGAPREAVAERLQKMGIDPRGL